MSKSIRKRRKRIREAQARRFKITAAMVVVAIVGIASGSYAGYDYLKGDGDWPTIEKLEPGRVGENSEVYAIDGSKMGVIPSSQNRTIISLKKMGELVPNAVIAIEDRRFRTHNGIDPKGIFRAVAKDLETGTTAEGASTITQQVIRNLYPQITTEKTFSRKAKEATLAIDLEKVWSKNRILEMYLNLVFFGNNAYGIEAAAQTYFTKKSANLTLPEAAMLAGLPQKPSKFDPFKNPQDALSRRNEVLSAMLSLKTITKAQYDAAVATPITVKHGDTYVEHRLPYFFDFVQQQLIEQYGAENVRQGGLRIHTTISPKLQKLAERAIHETLNSPGDPSAAMVVIDTKTGQIRAMASSGNYNRSKFNMAAQSRRQPGSTAKVWGLAALIHEGVNPETTSYTSAALRIRYRGAGEWWQPKTYDNSYGGTMSVASATIRSDNSVYAQIGLDLTPEKVVAMARAMGIKSPLQPVWSAILGSQVVTPLEQTNFYSTIARGGVRIDPRAIRTITSPSGIPIKMRMPRARRILQDWQAAEIVDILERNVQGGTGTGANFGWHEAGKTGTTDDHKDAWFCGMTPQLTACVWMGFNIPTPMYSVHGISVAGGTFPATIWRKFMEPALKNKKDVDFFSVHGVAEWIGGWVSGHWKDDPGIEYTGGADPNADKDEGKDKDKDTNKGNKTTPPPAGAGTSPPPASPTPPPPAPPVAPPPPPAPTPPAPVPPPTP